MAERSGIPDAHIIQRLRQAKMNALVARNLHRHRLTRFQRLNLLVDLLALAVPVSYFAVRFLAKNTSVMHPVEIVWEVLAGLLLALSIAKLALKWPERALTHTNLMAKDLSFIAHVDYLSALFHDGNMTHDAMNLFLLSANQNTEDEVALSDTRPSERQAAYREALKEIDPSGTDPTCPNCRASPDRFTQGRCQLCGNTPIQG